jgi:hypothetical protein
MIRYACLLTLVALWAAPARPADLVISGQSNKTYTNGTYNHLSISNSSNITIRNCTFSTSYAANGGGGVADISGSNHILIDSCDFNGNTTTCTGINMLSGPLSYITIQNCNIHDVADDGFQCFTGNHLFFYGNTICHLYGCGTQGGCGPCFNGHSDGWELWGVDTVELKRNLVYDVRSTCALFAGDNTNGATIKHATIENNIFYTPECGIVVYFFYADYIKMNNNTIWKSNWLGVSIGQGTAHLEAYNNIIMCIDYTYGGTTYNPALHLWDYNLVGFTGRGMNAQTHDVVNSNPRFRKIPFAMDNTSAHVYRTVTPADFELMAGSPAIGVATTSLGVPSTDFYGRPRTAPYDMGAIESENNGNGIGSLLNWGRNSFRPSLLSISPNPCPRNTPVTITGYPGTMPTRLEIYSMTGQKVCTLPANPWESSLVWDGKDMEGHSVKTGLYQVKLSARNSSYIERLVILQ